MIIVRRALAGVLAVLVLGCGWGAGHAANPIVSGRDRVHPVTAPHGMVATQEATATRVGVDMLRKGGNAIDAAVAVGFALAVTLPRAGNLGGGGFMLIHHANSGETKALDYREKAPAAATREMFLDEQGEVDERKARYTHRSVGVPGTVAGLTESLARYGTLPLADVLRPAIDLARNGILVTPQLSAGLQRRAKHLRRWPATRAIFFDENGNALRPGERLVQTDLAWSLTEIAQRGPGAFYAGEIGKRIVAEMRANDGLITEVDLQSYRAVFREPVWGEYRGHRIASMPPPSSGGVHLVQVLNLLEGFPLAYLGANGAETIHLMVESMKLAYADRSEYLGDPDFWKVPVRGLTSKRYAAQLRKTIERHRARPSSEIRPGKPAPYESDETTHFSVMDRFGNVVSNTYTLNFSYGAGIIAARTGIFLNNEMDDFSAKPGVPNAYGLLGGEANAIEPGKRPLSSMTPTIVFKDEAPWLSTGTPGGSRIITTTVQVLLNVIDHQMNIAEATLAPRVHHQWLPDELRIEGGLGPDTERALARRGHRLVRKPVMGSVQSVMRASGMFLGASDSRRPGALAAGLSHPE